MTFNPMLHPLLLTLVGLALVAVVIAGMMRGGKRTRLLWLGRLIMVFAIIGAILRPGVGSVATSAANTELDVVFVVDLSGSSAAEDWGDRQPRLEGMRADVAELAVAHAGARYALITFDSKAQYRLPFTTDATALEKAMQLAQPQPSYRSWGSSIGAGAGMLEEVLASAYDYNPDRMRVVYYLGDGEMTSDQTPERYDGATDLIQGGAVLGYGTSQGGPMRDSDPYGYHEYIRDARGQEGISVIDEDALQEIADDLGVEYQHRDAETPVDVAPVDPGRGAGAEERGGVSTFPIYWTFALVIVAWMLVEIWWLVRNTRELRTAKEVIS